MGSTRRRGRGGERPLRARRAGTPPGPPAPPAPPAEVQAAAPPPPTPTRSPAVSAPFAPVRRRRGARSGLVLGALSVVVAMVAAGLAYRVFDDDEGASGTGGAAEPFLDERASGETDIGSSRLASIDGHARSVVVSGTVRHLPTVDLQGIAGFSLTGEVTDAVGTELGRGIVESDAAEVRARGSDLSLEVTFLALTPSGGASISSSLMPDSNPAAGYRLTARGGRLAVEAERMTFRSYEQEDGDPEPVPVSSPITVRGRGGLRLDYEGDDLTWVDVPAGPITVASGWLTWAGSGANGRRRPRRMTRGQRDAEGRRRRPTR